ncbi:Uncharacterised protein [Mycobacteroides abscessus subsp. abscessus]|nr:Uncharacterised protein [Mycobacteroides abscessus subsp. abscessus]
MPASASAHPGQQCQGEPHGTHVVGAGRRIDIFGSVIGKVYRPAQGLPGIVDEIVDLAEVVQNRLREFGDRFLGGQVQSVNRCLAAFFSDTGGDQPKLLERARGQHHLSTCLREELSGGGTQSVGGACDDDYLARDFAS